MKLLGKSIHLLLRYATNVKLQLVLEEMSEDHQTSLRFILLAKEMSAQNVKVILPIAVKIFQSGTESDVVPLAWLMKGRPNISCVFRKLHMNFWVLTLHSGSSSLSLISCNSSTYRLVRMSEFEFSIGINVCFEMKTCKPSKSGWNDLCVMTFKLSISIYMLQTCFAINFGWPTKEKAEGTSGLKLE